jgi:hypothetical protein
MPSPFMRTAFPLSQALEVVRSKDSIRTRTTTTPTPPPPPPPSHPPSSMLKHSPSTISSNSQSSISISIRRRVSTIVSKFQLRTGGGGSLGRGSFRGRSRYRTTSTSTSTSAAMSAIQHISSVPWPRSPSRSPSPPSPDIRPPSGLGRRASSISDLEILALDSPSLPPTPPTPPSPVITTPLTAPGGLLLFPKPPNVVPAFAVRPSTALAPPASSVPLYQPARRTRTLSSPAHLSSLSETSPVPVPVPAPEPEPPAPPPKDTIFLPPTPQSSSPSPSLSATSCTPCTPRHARLQARQNPPIPLSLLFPYIPRTDLPTLSLVSRRFRNAAQLALYRTLVFSTTDVDDTDACIARLATAPHLAVLVTTLVIPAYPTAQGASFQLALAIALRGMRALSNLTLPAYDADLLLAVTELSASSAAGGLTHLTLLTDTLPFSFFDQFLVSNPTIEHLSLPNFIGVPPGPGEVPSTAIPNLVSLDASPGLAVSLAPGRQSTLEQVTLRVASTLYDGLRPAAIFEALLGATGCGQMKVLELVLAADVDTRTRGRLLGALAKMGEGLEELELRLEGTSDEVRSVLPPIPQSDC